ncbi:MAG TPA: TetR family transcriptional regulator [Candidatus Limnocylindria bacterium]|nr:TetR family transcriptional regulator [Candidatus Limnocylindria bacterium]
MRRTGRRAGSADTRGEILSAARQVFGEHGFENASVRKVAARAGVDPALVHHYFGTKQALFLAAMELPIDFKVLVDQVASGPRSEIGARLVRQTLELWEDPATRSLLMGIVRSATTDEVAAEILRGLLSEGPILALSRASGQPDADLRATLAGSQVVGLAMARYVIGVEPLASASIDDLVRAIGPTVQRYLVGRV